MDIAALSMGFSQAQAYQQANTSVLKMATKAALKKILKDLDFLTHLSYNKSNRSLHAS